MNLTNKINPYIFRGYDIRGTYPKDLNEDIAYTIGKSYGTYLQLKNSFKCVVGYDNRYSSVELSNALIKGILDTGVDVVSIGLVTTPMYYYACIKLDIPAGVMVTASHNPKDDNGFKFAFDSKGNACGEEIVEFKNFTYELNFKTGQGNLTTYDIEEEYIELMKKSLDFGNRRIKAVVDCANGTTSIIARKLYEQFPIDLTMLFDENDSTFPNHHPDPCVESNLEKLRAKVLEINADIGISFDGDGDRIGFVDEIGNFIPVDKFMIVMIRDMIDKVPNKKFLFDVKCSNALPEEIEKLNGEYIRYRTGNSYTKRKTREENCALGGELSGHVYFRDKFIGIDSGMYAGLRMVELLSRTDSKMSELFNGINKYYSTEELKFETKDEIKFDIVNKIKQYCLDKNYQILDIDGVRAEFDEGWALIRASNTGPTITARFEGKTLEYRDKLMKEFIELINEYNK